MLAAILSTLIQRPRLVLMATLLLMVSGVSSYNSIPREATPDIALPFVDITLDYEGISPQNAESLLLKPLETELRSLDGLKEMSATAKEGAINLALEFYTGVDQSTLVSRVAEKVDRAKALFPEDADEPRLRQRTAANTTPVIGVVLYGDQNYRSLVAQARQLKKRLEALPQVMEIELLGEREEVVDIEISPERLHAYGLDLGLLSQALIRNSRIVPAGRLQTERGEFSISVPTLFEQPEDILDYPLVMDSVSPLRVSDIADIRFHYRDAPVDTRFNGHTSIELRIYKRAGEHVFDTIEDIKSSTEALSGEWPAQTRFSYVNDASEEVSDMIKDLQNSILLSVLLVVILLVAALGLRSALIVGFAIPTSFLAGILVLGLLGYTINNVVLFSLIMAVGLLVDGAIVVIEYARRRIAEGRTPSEAYIDAAQSMSWPIIASTATTLCAFVTLMFWPGFFGEFMKYIPLTLITTLAASLLIALIVVPTLGRLFDRGKSLNEAVIEPADRVNSAPYLGFIRAAVNKPYRAVAAILIAIVLIVAAFVQSGLGVDFFPDMDAKYVDVVVRDEGVNYSLEERRQIMGELYHSLAAIEAIDKVRLHSGGEGEIGRMYITLVDWQQRVHSRHVADDIRHRLASAPYSLDISNVDGPQQGKAFQLEFSGHDMQELENAILWVRARIERDSRFVNIDDEAPDGSLSWQLELNRTLAMRYGVDVAQAGSMVRMSTNGVYVGAYHPSGLDEEVDVRVRFPDQHRHLSQLDRLTVSTEQGQIHLSDLMVRTAKPKVAEIKRVDGKRTMLIAADLVSGVQLNEVLPEFNELLQQKFGGGTLEYRFRGEAMDQAESGSYLLGAFMVALFMMGIILVAQFNSFYQMLLVLSAVVLAAVGVLIGLMIKQQPFSIVMSGIGVISLAGIVVNNNIVLIDTFNVLRARGLSPEAAALQTIEERLRPVLLTTITTILGLMPLVLGVNISLFESVIQVGAPSSAYWNILATAIVSGLGFATVVTLILVPCLLVIGCRRPQAQVFNSRADFLRRRLAHKLRV